MLKTLLLLLLPLAATAQTPAFTVEQALDYRFPSALTAAPVGHRVAWVYNQRGVRNLWTSAPNEKARPLTTYTTDDGQDLSDLRWTADASTLLFVRGSGANGQGENPNPTQNPDGAEQVLYATGLAGQPPRRLATGSAPTPLPDGQTVLFLLKGQVWSVGLDGKAAATQLLKLRGRTSALRLSPGGQHLAFVSTRSDHSFVGTYEFATKTVRFLDPSVDLDLEPAWSPDGRQLAWVRVPGQKNILPFAPEREGEPWSIHAADVATGAARQVWRAGPGRGSVPFLADFATDNWLAWGAGDRLTFKWERDDWQHLYSVPASGGTATLLTPGQGEVEYVTLSPDRKDLVYNTNVDDINRRHLWRVPVAGGKPTRLTPGQGIEWAPTLTPDGTVYCLRSEARVPAQPVVLTPGGPQPLAPNTDAYPSAQLSEPQAVTLQAADGMAIPAQLFLPKNAKAGDKRPAVIFFHGGSRRQMLLGFHYGQYYHHAYALNQYLASQGYVVLAVNYRSGIGYGMAFREALHYGAAGASEFNDVVGAGLYLRGRPEVDGSKIALWGGSYGGYLTALGLCRAPELFACGVDIHGVHDWNVVVENFAPGYDPKAREAFARLAYESSPMAHLSGWRAPVLLIHGDDDRNVPFSETVTLAEGLRKQKVDFEQLIFPDEVHSFLRHANWLAAYQATTRFLDKHLRK